MAKRRSITEGEELEMWAMTFKKTGRDFFGDLDAIGLIEPAHVSPMEDQPAAQRRFTPHTRKHGPDDLGRALS